MTSTQETKKVSALMVNPVFKGSFVRGSYTFILIFVWLKLEVDSIPAKNMYPFFKIKVEIWT